jgi:hypothetical protein
VGDNKRKSCTAEKCEATMFKAGTLPLNMYRSSDHPKDKVSFDTDAVEKEPVMSVKSASTTTSHEKDDEVEVRVEEDEKVEEDYDADDLDSDHATVDSGESNSLDSLTFRRVVTTVHVVDERYEFVYRMTKVTNVDIGMTFPIQMQLCRLCFLKTLFFP